MTPKTDAKRRMRTVLAWALLDESGQVLVAPEIKMPMTFRKKSDALGCMKELDFVHGITRVEIREVKNQ